MAGKLGFFDFVKRAFNARPFGMFVPPNWMGLAAMGLLGLANPGFWVLGAGLELGYLLVLATNARFQPAGRREATIGSRGDWDSGSTRALAELGEPDRRRYQTIADRCRSILDLQTATRKRRRPDSMRRRKDWGGWLDVPAAADRAPGDREVLGIADERSRRRADQIDRALERHLKNPALEASCAAAWRVRSRSSGSASIVAATPNAS